MVVLHYTVADRGKAAPPPTDLALPTRCEPDDELHVFAADADDGDSCVCGAVAWADDEQAPGAERRKPGA